MNFVVLSSSRGTVMEAVFERMKEGAVTAKCLGVVADKKDRGCIARAEAFGIRTVIVDMKKGEPREEYDKRIDAAIRSLGANETTLVTCMGWMWMLSPWFVKQWSNRIVNVHPALLPKHPGAHAHDLVLKAGDTESGMTIHLIDEGMDTGKILLQKTCEVKPNDTVDSLKARVQALECEWYPKAIEMMKRGEIRL